MKLCELFCDLDYSKIFVPLDKGSIFCEVPKNLWVKVDKDMSYSGIKGYTLPHQQQKILELFNNLTLEDPIVWLSRKYEPDSKSYRVDISKLNNNALRAMSWDSKYVVYRGEIPLDAIISRRGFGPINESKIIKVGTNNFKPILVYQNPSNREIIQLLNKHDMRGIEYKNTVYVWNAFDGVHDFIAEELGLYSENPNMLAKPYKSFIISNTDDFSAFDHWEGDGEQGNGVYYMSDSTINSSMFSRMIGNVNSTRNSLDHNSINESVITEYKEIRIDQEIKPGSYWFNMLDNTLIKTNFHCETLVKNPGNFGVTIPEGFKSISGEEYPELIWQALQHNWARIMVFPGEINIETTGIQEARKAFVRLNQPVESYIVDIRTNDKSDPESFILRGKRLQAFISTGRIPPQRGFDF